MNWVVKKVIIILGPTAVGKSEVAINCAGKLNGEIISADSMQVYKELNIGTAKNSKSEMQGISHHLIDIRHFNENYNVWEFVKDCNEKIEKILSENKMPIIVGGTNLYIKALIENYDFENKPKQATLLRVELSSFTQDFGLGLLYKLLKTLNPSQAEKIKPNDKSRILRAVECLILQENNKEKFNKIFADLLKNEDEKSQESLLNLLTKINSILQKNEENCQENLTDYKENFDEILQDNLTIFQSSFTNIPQDNGDNFNKEITDFNDNICENLATNMSDNDEKITPIKTYDFKLYALNLPRDLLYELINKRVDKMIENGLLDEVKKLKNQGLNLEMQAGKSIGYKEFLEYLDGKTSYDFAVGKIKQHSRNYAKRQLTWLRSMKDIIWLDALNKTKAVETILKNEK